MTATPTRGRGLVAGLLAAVLVAPPAVRAQVAEAPDPAAGQHDPAQRKEVWDLKPGTALADMPALIEFKGYACGSNGGPPLRPIGGWSDFALCRAEPGTGLHEVYFEYDDEAEYVLRAMNNPRVARFVGTTDKSFPVVTSALFDDGGVLRGIRVVTDPRPDYTADAFFDLAAMRPRADHYLLGPFLGAQFVIDPERDCVDIPLGPRETPVGSLHVKIDCDKVDEAAGLRYILQTRYFRKAGQLARDPVSGALTVGQFESLTRAEVYQLGYGPAEPLVPR